MATKRTVAYVHPSRKENVPNEPRRKRQKPDNAGAKSFKKAHAVNDLKSQIRSLKRLLTRNDGLPADVRIEKERALRTAEHELERAQTAQQRNEMIGRYHKIRFFDKQKASKRLKRARKELDEREDGGDSQSALQKRVQDAEVDVNYAQYFPLHRHYVSLFPRRKATDDDDGEDAVESREKTLENERKGDLEMWARVKQCMADGTLDALRNGKLTASELSAQSTNAKQRPKMEEGNQKAAAEPNGRTAVLTHSRDHDVDSESDGFFE